MQTQRNTSALQHVIQSIGLASANIQNAIQQCSKLRARGSSTLFEPIHMYGTTNMLNIVREQILSDQVARYSTTENFRFLGSCAPPQQSPRANSSSSSPSPPPSSHRAPGGGGPSPWDRPHRQRRLRGVPRRHHRCCPRRRRRGDGPSSSSPPSRSRHGRRRRG